MNIKKDLKDYGTYMVMWRPTPEKLASKGINPKQIRNTSIGIYVGVHAVIAACVYGPYVTNQIKIRLENRKIDKYNKKK